MQRASLALVLLLALPAFGQGPAGDAQVEFRVTRFDPSDAKPPVYQVGPEAGGAVEVEVPLTYIAGPFKARLRDGRFLDFWQGGEKPEYSIAIDPDERKDLLLLFVPGKDDFQVLKVSTPVTRIRGGDRLVVNATARELALKLGEEDPIRVAPGKSGLLRGPGGKEVVSLPVLVSQKKGQAWELASSENWPCDPRFRKYLFAYLSPRTHHLIFHSVSEKL